MAIVEEDLERVRATLVLSDVVQQYVALRRVGRNWVGLCPFHAERSGSFNVRDETGRYKCFGCGAARRRVQFVQEIEHVDFVAAVEQLAAKAGIQLRYTTGGEGKDRQRRKQLVEAMATAVDWYHERLLDAPDAREARDYLRRRGLAGDVARTFKLGWAPDDWDALCRDLKLPADVLRDTGLAFTNKAGRLQDSFRGAGDVPDLHRERRSGGLRRAHPARVSADPAKYKNSSETPIYAKSKTLYGLNWAKGDIVAADQVIVCEGYTDVIGFHRAGVPRAVATCGTALTEDHVRLLKRYASQVVLAFDADAAGQGAAERFYEWEERYQVRGQRRPLPRRQGPGRAERQRPRGARSTPSTTRCRSSASACKRVLDSRPPRSPEERARMAERGDGQVVNEHPDANVRKLYAGQVAAHVGLPVARPRRASPTRRRAPVVRVAPGASASAPSENAEFVAIALLLQRWDDIAPWLMEELFADESRRRAFLAVAEAGGAHRGGARARRPRGARAARARGGRRRRRRSRRSRRAT